MRFLPQDETYVVLRPDFTKLGRLINISKGGLAFRYIAHQRQEQAPTHLDLFVFNDAFYLPRIPCRVIYDIRLSEKQRSSASLERRRCGLELGEVTEVQASQLELYLKKHVAGEA